MVAGVAGPLSRGRCRWPWGIDVSVSSQRDAEQADVERETRELTGRPRAELNELALIYVKRGLDNDLAMKVAQQLSTHDRLGAHLRDELGIDRASRIPAIAAVSLISLAGLGAFGGRLGGAPLGRAAWRVTIGARITMWRSRSRDRAPTLK